MNGKYLLDTNIVIALFAGETGLRDSLSTAEEVFLSTIAVGELYYGARKSSKPHENLVRIDELVLGNVVLGCDSATARQYAAIKNALRIKGRPLPENDIWIAAIAIQHDLILVTRDAHFDQIEGLDRITW
jgi:tRNA(fMet)-specific endonuclease VapC